jgi:ubiquinone/menaquinone biosynthesis C-methylase UbiE
MKWFPLFRSPGESLAVSMAGVKLGDRLLIVGCGDPVLIARLAVKTGLTGRAYAVDEAEALTRRAAEVALREGALIEAATTSWQALPCDASAFDVAVIRDVLPNLAADRGAACVAEVHRVLRPGGRCLVIDTARRTGVGALLRPAPAAGHYGAPDNVVRALETRGFRAARLLAQREGLVFVEGVKGNLPGTDNGG